MTVYVDDSLITAKVGRLESQWSHLFADSQTELHAFAERLGLQRDWYQPDKHGGGLWHYDVTARKRLRAIQLGAQPVTWREAVDIMRERDNRPTNRREVAGDAGTADLAAGHAYQAGDLVRAAWLVRDAMDQDTSRAEHWAGRMDRSCRRDTAGSRHSDSGQARRRWHRRVRPGDAAGGPSQR